MIQDDQSQYTINKTLQRLLQDSDKGSLIYDSPIMYIQLHKIVLIYFAHSSSFLLNNSVAPSLILESTTGSFYYITQTLHCVFVYSQSPFGWGCLGCYNHYFHHCPCGGDGGYFLYNDVRPQEDKTK